MAKRGSSSKSVAKRLTRMGVEMLKAAKSLESQSKPASKKRRSKKIR